MASIKKQAHPGPAVGGKRNSNLKKTSESSSYSRYKHCTVVRVVLRASNSVPVKPLTVHFHVVGGVQVERLCNRSVTVNTALA